MSVGNVLVALDGVRKALVEGADDEEFARAAETFLTVFRANMAERGLDEWDELAQLAAFEWQLAADHSLDVDYAAACKTVRDLLTMHRHEQAKLN
jgi:hypothetical protein